jgi:hypothetical protein
MNPQPFAYPHFTLVHCMSFSSKTGITCRLPVSIANAEGRVKFVRREIEDHHVIREIHMTVGVYPFRADDIVVHDERAAHAMSDLMAMAMPNQAASAN